MAITLPDGTYQCSFCKKIYDKPTEADNCRDAHQLIYIPFTHNELGRLAQFLFSRNENLLTETMVQRILDYASKEALT